jgi:hypothetical protein
MLGRRRLHPLFASLLGVWFALLSVVPTALRPCVMHVAAPSGQSTHDLPSEHNGHAAHGSHGAPASAPDTPAPIHPCDCLTGCCDAPVARQSLAVRLRETPALSAAPRPPAPTPERPRTRFAARLLPFANGPPVLIHG